MGGLIYYKENMRKYLKQVFKNFIEDGSIRIEARSFINNLVDESGNKISLEAEIEVY